VRFLWFTSAHLFICPLTYLSLLTGETNHQASPTSLSRLPPPPFPPPLLPSCLCETQQTKRPDIWKQRYPSPRRIAVPEGGFLQIYYPGSIESQTSAKHALYQASSQSDSPHLLIHQVPLFKSGSIESQTSAKHCGIPSQASSQSVLRGRAFRH